MSVYLFVHGAWGGANNWSGIIKRLRLAGQECHYASLTGLGEKVHQAHPGITLSDHIADVTGVIDHHGLSDIILVGHSYGGMVISGVAALRSEHVRTLVYVDAFLPKDGEALWDIADDPSRKHYIDAQRESAGLVAPFPGSPDHLTRHPLLTLTEPVHLDTAMRTIEKRTYIYATQAAPTVFTKFYDRVKNDSKWRAHSINTSHRVMQDDPDGLTTLLLAEATEPG